MFLEKHKLTVREQAKIYFNQRIGMNFAEIIKDYRRNKPKRRMEVDDFLGTSSNFKKEVIDRRPFNIKEFELKDLKKQTKGLLNGIINMHIRSLRKKRKDMGSDKQMIMTKDGKMYTSPKRNHVSGIRKSNLRIPKM